MIEKAPPKTAALRKIAAKNYHSEELLQALIKKGYSRVDLQAALEELQEMGYLNNEEWGASFCRQAESKMWSLPMVQNKLRIKGLSMKEITRITSLLSHGLEERLKRLISLKYSNVSLEDPKEKFRVYRSLVQKGFSSDLIQRVLNDLPS